MGSEVIVTEDELPTAVIDAIRNGRKIEAIKILREEKNLGLANAQVLVDKAWRRHGPEKKIRSFADQPRGLGSLGKSLAMLLIIAAAWYFYRGG
jgi:hypothetical protein